MRAIKIQDKEVGYKAAKNENRAKFKGKFIRYVGNMSINNYQVSAYENKQDKNSVMLILENSRNGKSITQNCEFTGENIGIYYSIIPKKHFETEFDFVGSKVLCDAFRLLGFWDDDEHEDEI